jgi:glycosyltransferase involved in cell wall biosynthesis
MERRLKLAVGIATVGRREQMPLTLAQLARQQLAPERIVVCPASPADYDIAATPALPCPVEVLPGPRGLTAQRNRILEACPDIDVLVFIDDDYYPAPDYLAQVAALFDAFPDIVVATHHPLRDGATGPGIPHAEAVDLIDTLPPADGLPRRIRDTYGGYGCNMSVRVATAQSACVRFDTNLPLYGWLEDIDFSRRMSLHGRVVTCNRLRGVHLATKRGRTSGLRFGYSQVANPLYLLGKGSMSHGYAWRHIVKNVAKNAARSVWPEPWVDRRGRLRGNLVAALDGLLGRLDPRRVVQLD